MLAGKSLVALASLSVLVGAGVESCVAGRGPNTDNPDDGTAQCVVVERQNNSNGTLYVKIDCNGGDTADLGPSGGIRAFVNQTDYPMCRVGAAWPGCKEEG
jgi:hypothetical protein